MAHNTIDETGKRYGRLLVLERAGTNNRRLALWRCKCDCGKEFVTVGRYLRRSKVQSCGCYRSEKVATNNTKHGMAHTETYNVWLSMKARCTIPSASSYKNYGGRGIAVCGKWLNDFPSFLEDMGLKPHPESTIDRIDNNGPYSPENCRWTTRKNQARNKRNNVSLTFRDKTQTIAEWAEEMNINYYTLHKRLKAHGWTVERALTTPVRK